MLSIPQQQVSTVPLMCKMVDNITNPCMLTIPIPDPEHHRDMAHHTRVHVSENRAALCFFFIYIITIRLRPWRKGLPCRGILTGGRPSWRYLIQVPFHSA